MADKDKPETPQPAAPRRRSRVMGSSWSAPTRSIDAKKGDLPKPKPETSEEIPVSLAVQPAAVQEEPRHDSVPPDSTIEIGAEDVLVEGDLTPLVPPVFEEPKTGLAEIALPRVATQDVSIGESHEETPPSPTAPSTPPPAEEIVCGNCDAENPGDSKVCRQCSMPFAAQTMIETTIDDAVFEFGDTPSDVIVIGRGPFKGGVRTVRIEHPSLQPVHAAITKNRLGEYYMRIISMRGTNGEMTIRVNEGDKVQLAPLVSLIIRIKDAEGLPKSPPEAPPTKAASDAVKAFATGPTIAVSTSEPPPAAPATAQPAAAPVPEPDPFRNRSPGQRQIIDPELSKELSATAREIHRDNSRPPPERRPVLMPQNPPPPPPRSPRDQHHPEADAAVEREVEVRRVEETSHETERRAEHAEHAERTAEPKPERKRRYQLPALMFAFLAVLIVGGLILKGNNDASKKPAASAAPSFSDASEVTTNAGVAPVASVPVVASVAVVAPSAMSVVVKTPPPAPTAFTSCVPLTAALMQEHLGQNDPSRLTKATTKTVTAKVHCPKGKRAKDNGDGTLNVSWCSLCPLEPQEM